MNKVLTKLVEPFYVVWFSNIRPPFIGGFCFNFNRTGFQKMTKKLFILTLIGETHDACALGSAGSWRC